MNNLIGSLLPDELMAQAARIDGILYLPAYELAAQLLRLSLPIALLLIFIVLLIGLSIVFFVSFLLRSGPHHPGS